MAHSNKQRKTHRGQLTNAQKALLHVAAGQLGLDDATYRDILERFAGVRSSVALDQGGFERVMEHLETCGFKKAQGSKHKAKGPNDYQSYYEQWKHQLGHRAGMGSPGQLALIDTLWDQLAWYWNKDGRGNRNAALRGFLLGRFSTEHLAFLTFDSGGKVIEAMKAIGNRRETRSKGTYGAE